MNEAAPQTVEGTTSTTSTTNGTELPPIPYDRKRIFLEEWSAVVPAEYQDKGPEACWTEANEQHAEGTSSQSPIGVLPENAYRLLARCVCLSWIAGLAAHAHKRAMREIDACRLVYASEAERVTGGNKCPHVSIDGRIYECDHEAEKKKAVEGLMSSIGKIIGIT